MSIVVRTLSKRVFEIVREQVASGQLPGKLGVSKIPLREARAWLEQEGLVTNQATRGCFVGPMSSAKGEKVFQLLLKIEPIAAAR